MIYHILYNPKSRSGSRKKVFHDIKKRLKPMDITFHDITKILHPHDFMKTLSKDDVCIVVGGDGTLHHLINQVYPLHESYRLAMYQSGTGNDFIRSLHTKKTFPHINPYLKALPTIEVSNTKHYFINGVGIGLDGYVGHIIESRHKKKSKYEFFRSTLIAIKKFKPFISTVKTDAFDMKTEKTWFISVMYGPYFGGGMKIAPNQDRTLSHLTLILVKDCPKWLLFIIFPSIYFGKHTRFTKYVSLHPVTDVLIEAKTPQVVQMDGEVHDNIVHMKVNRY